ncbi:MAG: glycosyltransferase family 2 protein [Acidobacteria bacterium]|mgnify:CR=1 FL=1|nr:MAG: glycosyltransferase family 2 protein [Acidobacteriota bacterium]REK01457.1 MAG: glycosyltransferase family 2 protein [Acidobacteriota bacterium]REK14413.1 MAG: glycosyltransferase family 2 protein [Acidobacteriota bacterium]REK45128.1 MAG: glycosyltransferase family 2 protein [Acidobacteriota bacterium]
MTDTRPLKKVAVVTPVHNRRDITLQCLRSLSRIDREGLQLSVYVVDDGSTDGTSEAIASQFPDVKVIRGDGNLWFTGGMNRGIEAALEEDPEYILSINDDSIFQPDCLVRLVECAESNPRSVVGPLLLLWNEPHRLFQVSPEWSVLAGGFRHWRHQTVWSVPEQPWETDIIVGNCVLLPSDAIRECGLMNEKRHPHWGDAEYTPRMKRMGWKLLVEPKARVFCQPNDPPPRLREMPPRKLLNALFGDLKGPHSLRRRLLCSLDGGPSKISGLAAFAVFLARTLLGNNPETSWAEGVEELPLKERFKDRVITGRIRSNDRASVRSSRPASPQT